MLGVLFYIKIMGSIKIDCNKIGEKHHDDYTKPLEIRYLCKKHHDDFTWKRELHGT